VLVVTGPPFLAGLRGRALLGLAWPLLFCAVALVSSASESEHYDMAGLGLRLFGAAAVGSLLALLVGMGIRGMRT
jgi:hypothetical protein